MEVAYVTIAMVWVAQSATILVFAVIVTERVKNGMNAGYVGEQVNATTVTDKDGRHALIAMVKAEKPVLNVMVKGEKPVLCVVGMASWHAHIVMGEDGIHAPFVMETGEECKLVHC